MKRCLYAVPVVALIVSTLFEGYRPTLATGVGAALAVLGNALILRPRASSNGMSRR